MKKRILLALMTTLLVLSGCSSQDVWEERLEAKRQELGQCESISFTAAVTAELDAEAFSCTLSCVSNSEGMTLEVLEPELVKGVKAHVGEDSRIEYDGVQLYIGDLTQSGLSPVSAVALLIDSLKSGFVERMWQETYGETELLVLQIYESDELTVKLWLDTESLEPLYGEVVSFDAAVMKLQITDFTAG